tara:strand:+ start:225 stop:509 length:285 start_codon:yes stop_codon:yes gene_type:complete
MTASEKYISYGNETEEMETYIYLRSVSNGVGDFIRAIPEIDFLWQLYYSADAKVNNPHPSNPNAKTFKDWLIHLTPEQYELDCERYYSQTALKP